MSTRWPVDFVVAVVPSREQESARFISGADKAPNAKELINRWESFETGHGFVRRGQVKEDLTDVTILWLRRVLDRRSWVDEPEPRLWSHKRRSRHLELKHMSLNSKTDSNGLTALLFIPPSSLLQKHKYLRGRFKTNDPENMLNVTYFFQISRIKRQPC